MTSEGNSTMCERAKNQMHIQIQFWNTYCKMYHKSVTNVSIRTLQWKENRMCTSKILLQVFFTVSIRNISMAFQILSDETFIVFLIIFGFAVLIR